MNKQFFYSLNYNSLVKDVVYNLNLAGRDGLAFFHDEISKELLYVFTDGDIRRALLNGVALSANIKELINDKIKKVEDIIFKTDETGNTYMLNTHSGKYLFMKLQPLYKERELLSNKLYPEKKNDDDNINDDGNIYDNIDDDDNIYDNIDDDEVNKCQLMLERFAYLVAQQERERIAKKIEQLPFGDTAASFGVYVREA